MYAITTAASRWHCVSCNEAHDADVPALHVAQVRAHHDGAELTINALGCGQWPIGTLHRAAAQMARELTTLLREKT